MTDLVAAPALSTPDQQALEVPADVQTSSCSSETLLYTYEILHTARKIVEGEWNRVALQFPDHMLVDAPRVVAALRSEIDRILAADSDNRATQDAKWHKEKRIYVLADTSYSACCVDEIAAEHVDADVVVHYGRACLSPTSRLPTLYVYTHQELSYRDVFEAFTEEFADKESPVVVMADLTYQDHVEDIVKLFNERGYPNVRGTSVRRNPGGVIPNREIESGGRPIAEESLKSYHLFHISNPPSSLLLSLSSRFASLRVLSTSSSSLRITNPTTQTAALLRRRFARLLKVSTASTIGILVNTLSVSNYLPSIDILRQKISKAGKKSYTIVVGKLNPAKLANFAEIEGWVVVGCWESGLVEDEAAEYWRPVITPFELDVALMREEQRIWGGDWWGGMEKLRLDKEDESDEGEYGDDDDDEDAPPEFDLRTGKLVPRTRPMRRQKTKSLGQGSGGRDDKTQSLIHQAKPGELATINGVVSPGAEFLRSSRTWQGLGSDFAEIDADEEGGREESTVVEEGRNGIARGYRVGNEEKH